MAKLSDLVNVNINRDTIKIQNAELPVLFSMKAFPLVEEAYGKSYGAFEKDLNAMIKKGRVTLGKNETKLMYSLVYAMVKAAGTDCTPYEIENSIPISDISPIFQIVMEIFTRQNFQVEDMEKIKQEKK
ncbi:hypothetical protein [Terribacillus saccharophilus]|uniref:hypothetical protein n=1 Tax=Terribacillus saccharophilus TaxID=361277 RepID=UPI002DCF2AC9|nr:hypothetical protein [Terribacillus saccharophilus]MEC0288914.1 hypothetical protein [Terribacillus saccharophilus]